MSQADKNDTLYFAVPRMVAESMKVLRTAVDKATGIQLGNYVEDHLREGDWILVVRPPSLWAGNVQPMKVVFWEHECFGLSPSVAEDFHADHDGDEMQIYFIGSPESIEECKQWRRLTPNKFTKAIKTMLFPKSMYEGDEDILTGFMVHSTVSIKELMNGVKMPDKVFREFSEESIRGIRDVMAQQLNQGFLGDMSRQARFAASCVQYKGNGIFCIRTGCQTTRSICTDLYSITSDFDYPFEGNSCMRAISKICAVAQQAALDSHGVSKLASKSVLSKMDLINSFIIGGKESLVAFNSSVLPTCSWKYVSRDITFCIVNNEDVRRNATK